MYMLCACMYAVCTLNLALAEGHALPCPTAGLWLAWSSVWLLEAKAAATPALQAEADAGQRESQAEPGSNTSYDSPVSRCSAALPLTLCALPNCTGILITPMYNTACTCTTHSCMFAIYQTVKTYRHAKHPRYIMCSTCTCVTNHVYNGIPTCSYTSRYDHSQILTDTLTSLNIHTCIYVSVNMHEHA